MGQVRSEVALFGNDPRPDDGYSQDTASNGQSGKPGCRLCSYLSEEMFRKISERLFCGFPHCRCIIPDLTIAKGIFVIAKYNDLTTCRAGKMLVSVYLNLFAIEPAALIADASRLSGLPPALAYPIEPAGMSLPPSRSWGRCGGLH